jgi:hypothetical protein
MRTPTKTGIPGVKKYWPSPPVVPKNPIPRKPKPRNQSKSTVRKSIKPKSLVHSVEPLKTAIQDVKQKRGLSDIEFYQKLEGFRYKFVYEDVIEYELYCPNIILINILSQICDEDIYTFINAYFGQNIEHSPIAVDVDDNPKKIRLSKNAKETISKIIKYLLDSKNFTSVELAQKLNCTSDYIRRLKIKEATSFNIIGSLEFMWTFCEITGLKFDTLKRILLEQSLIGIDDPQYCDIIYPKGNQA